MDDLFEMLESDEKPFTKAPEEKSETSINLWDSEEIKPVKVDLGNFKQKRKLFAISYFTESRALPSDVYEKIISVSKVLISKGYTYRAGADDNNKLSNEILSLEGVNAESYAPWKKFNASAKNLVLFKPTEKAYGIAVNSHKAFYKIPPAVRAVLAKDVHMLLGKDCDEPVNVMITYTRCGSETTSFKMDYNVTGTVAFLLKVCEDSNIPVINLKKEDAVRRVAEMIKPKED